MNSTFITSHSKIISLCGTKYTSTVPSTKKKQMKQLHCYSHISQTSQQPHGTTLLDLLYIYRYAKFKYNEDKTIPSLKKTLLKNAICSLLEDTCNVKLIFLITGKLHTMYKVHHSMQIMSLLCLQPAIPAMASDAKYFTSTSLSTFSLSNTGLTCDSIQVGSSTGPIF